MKNNGILTTYQLVSDWLKLPSGYTTGTPVGIGIDSNQHIFIFSRAGAIWSEQMPAIPSFISEKTIIEIDSKTGKLINSWGKDIFVMPHGLTIDTADNIWLTDVELHQVFKYSHDGNLLMTIGEAGVAGNDASHFNRPTGVAVAKDGCFYVSDGYGNSRVVKFSAEGKYLFEWGSKGNGEAAFDIPHAIELDDNGNVYVADRENRRIQVFDSSGNFLYVWKHEGFGNLCSVVFNKKTKEIIAVDDMPGPGLAHTGSDIIVIDAGGTSFTKFGRSGAYYGPVCWYHDVTVDEDGNIYVLDLLGDQIQKFARLPAHAH